MRHQHEHDRGYRRHRDDHRHMPHQYAQQQQDFGNRWGEPEPRFGPGAHDRQMHYEERRDDRDEFHHNNWGPFTQPRNQHFRDREQEPEYYHRQPVWRQQDEHFSRDNQHANDRWRSDRHEPYPQPHERPRHTAEHFYREDRRRRH